MRGLRLALTTLTVYPVRGPDRPERADGRVAMMLAPLVGLAIWLPAGALVVLVRMAYPNYPEPLVPAVLGIAAVAALTRGLHLDGLADTVDGLSSYKPAPEALAIMRKGDVGALGVVTLVLVLVLQVTVLQAAVQAHHGTVALAVMLLTGRCAITLACREGTPVAAGSTLGALVIGTVPRAAAAAVTLLTIAVAVLGATLDIDTLDRSVELLQAGGGVVAGLACAELLRRHALRRLGGLSGDVLGALCELAGTVGLIVMSFHTRY